MLSEIDKYNQMKEETRGRQKQGVGLSEGENKKQQQKKKKKKKKKKKRADPARERRGDVISPYEDLHQAGKTGKST